MSYVRFQDEANGIGVYVVDNPTDANQRSTKWARFSYDAAHTVTFKMQLVDGTNADGSANDIVRVIVDGHDVGEETHTCFTSWEQWFRHGESREPPVTNSLIIMARSNSAPSVAGNGYLFDDVSYETRDTGGPAPTRCGTPLTGAFCSPGYWKNAPDSAWAKVGSILKTSAFNSVVVPDFYANAISPATPRWHRCLTPRARTRTARQPGPFGLNPYNAVGAALTSKLTGYVFDPAAVGALVDTCPLDGKGNWKPGAGPTTSN